MRLFVTADFLQFVRAAGNKGIFGLLCALVTVGPAAAQPAGFAGNAQHTAVYEAPAQRLNSIHWTAPVDLAPTGEYGHYGAPLVTPGNTVLVPVKTASGFQVSAYEAATGRQKYTLTTDFIMPPYGNWFPAYQPVIAMPPSGARLYYAGAGGTVYYIENLDSDTPTAPVQQCFFTNLAAYAANAGGTNGYTNTIFINTPLTAATNGVVFFGFRAQQNIPIPAPLNTTNDGFVRLDSDGNGHYVLAGAAAADPVIYRDSHNCAPALSNDGETLYVAAKATSSYAYLLGLDSVTLATKFRKFLTDPRNGQNASVIDIGTTSPLVGPDGDVYFGVMANPGNGSRGFMLHFTANLQTNKTPGGFGWDNTAAIVPTNMVPSYSGPSSYLLFSKYNNYAEPGDGDGINRIALLDPNATQIDPHPSANRLVEMREIMTVIGGMPDGQGTNYPYAVREWCINTAAVNPATKSVFAPSEDGYLYRWDLAANSLVEAARLTPGVGEPYVPTVIGPDGTVFTLNGGTLFALGSLTNPGVAIFSSAPDLRSVVAGEALTFTAIVTNLNGPVPAPTGTVTFEDRTWHGVALVTNIIATAVPLSNGVAAVTTTGLLAASNYLGSHLITAKYSGDGIFPAGSATLGQKVHAFATTTTLTSALTGSSNAVSFTAAVTSDPPGAGKPTGMVTFWDGSGFVAQVPLNTNGAAIFTNANYAYGIHAISASYASDTLFASSAGRIAATIPILSTSILPTNRLFEVTFTNEIGAEFDVLGSPDVSIPVSSWAVLGPAIEVLPGRYQFTTATEPGGNQQFYRVRSP